METFERVEKKYILENDKYHEFLNLASPYLLHDDYYKSHVRSIYYDTKDEYLINRSLEKPKYKEKIRIRCYGLLDEDADVYVELKKKFDGIVYKRRTSVNYHELKEKGLLDCDYDNKQVGREIKYLAQNYNLEPKILISTYRTSYAGKDDYDLRITFDKRITYRYQDLDLCHKCYGNDLIEKGQRLMEIKVNHSMPLWLVKILSDLNIYSESYSKYGKAYLKERGGE